MEGDNNFSKISQLENSPFSMMAPSTLPLSPSGLSQVWKRPYSMNHFENEEGNEGAATHFQPLDTQTTTGALNPTHTATTNPTPTVIPTPTPSTTTTEVEAIKDKGKKHQEEYSNSCDAETADQCNENKTVTVKPKEEIDDTPIGGLLQIRVGRNTAPESLDPRRLKRIYSNRVSAQKSRLKKLQYTVDMENKARVLEARVAVLSPQVEFFKNHNNSLQMERVALKEAISACAIKKLHNDALIEENKKEVQKWRLLHWKNLEQQKIQMQASMFMNMDGAGPMDPKMVNNPGFIQSKLEKMLFNPYSIKGITQANLNSKFSPILRYIAS
ncbi:basic leucine zipper 34-like [Argentina anserina]|uniref:basic leucine zipper 34-like n=1 Tax=Argentina anserina TaxID=57926 RepID=UPI0021768416|nr:basic leucine zipper 34-like [Potentilla anserina]